MIGVTFGSKHSYNDFGLILTSKSIPLPEPKTSTVDIPGADGSLDMSAVLTNGEVKYKNRPLQFVFTIINSISDWETVKSTFANYVHGKKMNVILDADPAYYYTGRCKISGFTPNKRTAQITVSVDADPYKYDVAESVHNLTVTSTSILTITGKRMPVLPTITVSANMDCVFKGVTYGLTAGAQQVSDIILTEGANVLTFTGSGTVSVKYRGGSL